MSRQKTLSPDQFARMNPFSVLSDIHDYVRDADRRKRNRLSGLGYRLVVVNAGDPGAGLDELAGKLG